tara:strand:- start:3511 stop:3720 length:210 start_codon:yes stop_codon:yes gene_type:complete
MSTFPIAKPSGKKTTEFTNLDVSKMIASTGVGKDILTRNHITNAAAKTAGLVDGDLYHTAGLLKIVYTP